MPRPVAGMITPSGKVLQIHGKRYCKKNKPSFISEYLDAHKEFMDMGAILVGLANLVASPEAV
jgi:hypothetical protein